MNYFSLFSGIGAFEKALDNLKILYQLVGFSEIDKYAVKSYCAIHGVDESKNLGDITKIDEKTLPKDIDLITYGFPCQDISLAGKQKGLFNEDGSQTRSGLFFEALRIIEATQPRVAIAENVKNLTGKKFSEQFKIVLDSLEQAGYNNYWKVLNAKDYGVPQNRERVFIVSIRKDIDTGMFQFPEGFPLELRLKDVLDDMVDPAFYLSNVQIDKLQIKSNKALVYDKSMIGFEGHSREYNDIMPTITSREWKEPRVVNESRLNEINMLGLLNIKGNEQVRRVYCTDGISPTLNTMQGGNRQPKVLVEPTIQRIDIAQTVKVRKYPVDCKLLCECLRNHKFDLNISNKEIAESLDIPLTKVEHWFRQDDCFAIPDPDVWAALKEILKIETEEFDEAILTFEEKEGVYEKSERHYFEDGIMPTLTSTTACCEKILVREATKKGYAEAVEGDSINLEHPNSNTRRGRVGHGVAQTLTTSPQQGAVLADLRIRKLTPKECFRLMGFTDEDFEKAEAVNSNTQLYKQAGNSIVVPVVEYIIKALFECGALKEEREEKEMELRVQTPTFPEVIQFNFDELKQKITLKSSEYVNLVYTEEQISEAKKDRAKLNKFVKALSDERIKIKKECLKPYEDFEAKIKELDGIVNVAIKNIDDQVKGFEEKQKNEKLEKIKNTWMSFLPPFPIKFEQIFDSKWLNATVSLKSIQTSMEELLAKIESDLATLENLPEFSFEAKEVYKTTLNLQQAIQEGARQAEIQKRKQEQERLKAEAEAKKHMLPPAEEFIPPVVDKELEEKAFGEPQRMWIGFKAHLTVEQAHQLKNFFDCRGIEFERIAI